MKKIILPFTLAVLLLSGCAAQANAAPVSDMVHIALNTDSITCNSSLVEISGSTATIRGAGSYNVSGELTDGMLIIDAEKTDDIQLVLEDAKINSESSAAIYVLQADKVAVTLADGSENELSNGGSFVAIDENDIDAVIFSKDDLTLDGTGSLKIISPAGHAVVSRDSLTINGGSYNLLAGGGSAKAEEKNSEMWGRFMGGEKMRGGKIPGMGRGEGQFMPGDMEKMEIPELPEGMEFAEMPEKMTPPEKPEEFVEAHTETSEDAVSMKGFVANDELTINSGNFIVDCAEDAFHSDLNLTVNGGDFEISSGDDAFHAEENLVINGGSINVSKSYEGLEAMKLSIFGGDIVINANDDGINAAGGTEAGFNGGMPGRGMNLSAEGSILIAGGNLNITAYGDGLDSNGSVEISGGNTVVCGPSYGDTAILDYYTSATISGGSFVGSGSTMMAQSFSEADQGLVWERLDNTASAGTEVELVDSAGNVIMTFTPALDFNLVIVSTPELSTGESYSINIASA